MFSRCFLKQTVKTDFITRVKSTASRYIYNNVEPLRKECKEVEVNVPWGKLVGKLWGAEDKQPILALHGWQDNAGSFDSLAPLLLKNASILAIDLPGHGLSSWLPPGNVYQELVYLMVIERLRRHFGWKKVKLLAHSMSAQISFLYTSVKPEETEFLIALDALRVISVDISLYEKWIVDAMSAYFRIEESDSIMKYTEKEIIDRWIAATRNSLDEAACRILMKRGTKKLEDGKYIFTRDRRVKVIPVLPAFSPRNLQKLVKVVMCPYLLIKAENSPYFQDKKSFYDVVDTLKEKNQYFQYERIPGRHHVHMTQPETVANIINPFLEKYNV